MHGCHRGASWDLKLSVAQGSKVTERVTGTRSQNACLVCCPVPYAAGVIEQVQSGNSM